MRPKLLLALAVVAALTTIAVPNGTATTQPVIQITIRVTVSDSAIKMSRLTAKRGWGGHFVIRNVGRKPHSVDLGGLKTATIKASFDERGTFPFRVMLNHAGPKHTGVFRVI